MRPADHLGFVVPDQHCPDCNALLDRASGMAAPKPGDLSVCAYCGAMLVFDQSLVQRALSEADFAALPEDNQRVMREYSDAARAIAIAIAKGVC